MSIKNSTAPSDEKEVYGIYLVYPPTVELAHEGLGRYLIAFLEAAANRSDIRFLVACPSWSREDLLKLCKDEGVPLGSFDLLSPKNKPAILRLYETYLKFKLRSKDKRRIKRIILWLNTAIDNHSQWVNRRLVAARTALGLVPIMAYASILALLKGVISACKGITKLYNLLRHSKVISSRFKKLNALFVPSKHDSSQVSSYWAKINALLLQPKNSSLFVRLYQFMEQHESELMLNEIKQCKQVKAWYCPTAFWPSFNKIQSPRLMCVPDVVLAEFPVGFCDMGGNRTFDNFKAVENAITHAKHFVTYSDHIKTNTLINRYGIKSSAINIVRHAPNDLSRWITVNGFPDSEATSHDYCQYLLICALDRNSNSAYVSLFQNKSVKFIFYASQFRPSKNILTLLRAYNFLLKKRYIGHKLILTGKPRNMPAIDEFIRSHHLQNDVLCLHGLSNSELAACYKLADLAVNPSLSEGACPFTLTEALSVGTPVVMAKISVTEEIIKDESLKEMMLFDPYDSKSVAQRIEWALANKEELLTLQLKAYRIWSQRNWGDVVNEHVEILKRISAE